MIQRGKLAKAYRTTAFSHGLYVLEHSGRTEDSSGSSCWVLLGGPKQVGSHRISPVNTPKAGKSKIAAIQALSLSQHLRLGKHPGVCKIDILVACWFHQKYSFLRWLSWPPKLPPRPSQLELSKDLLKNGAQQMQLRRLRPCLDFQLLQRWWSAPELLVGLDSLGKSCCSDLPVCCARS